MRKAAGQDQWDYTTCGQRIRTQTAQHVQGNIHIQRHGVNTRERTLTGEDDVKGKSHKPCVDCDPEIKTKRFKVLNYALNNMCASGRWLKRALG